MQQKHVYSSSSDFQIKKKINKKQMTKKQKKKQHPLKKHVLHH